MKRLCSLALEQKENARHGESFFPVQKYTTALTLEYPVVTTHWHEEAEFTLIDQGRGLYHIDLNDYPVAMDDLIFIPPLLLHSFSRFEDQDVDSETYVFHMNFLGGNATDICSTRYLAPISSHELLLPCLIKPSHPAYASLRKIFSQISSLYADAPPGYELALKSLFLQVMFLLVQYSEKNHSAGETYSSVHSEKLKLVLDYIEQHYADTITVSDLARLCYFSEYYFMRFFKKHMNMTCMEYINNLRLEKAVALFEQGNASILEVSLSVGFHNLSYFHRAFKKKYRTTPLQFLKQL